MSKIKGNVKWFNEFEITNGAKGPSAANVIAI